MRQNWNVDAGKQRERHCVQQSHTLRGRGRTLSECFALCTAYGRANRVRYKKVVFNQQMVLYLRDFFCGTVANTPNRNIPAWYQK